MATRGKAAVKKGRKPASKARKKPAEPKESLAESLVKKPRGAQRRPTRAPTGRDNYNFLQRVYGARQIRHTVVKWLYREMREIIEDAAAPIGAHTLFFDAFIIDCAVRVATKTLRSTAIFHRDEDLQVLRPEEHEDYDTHSVMLVEVAIDMLYVQSIGGGPEDRDFATMKANLPFVPAVYDILIESFVRAAMGYRDGLMDSLGIRQRIIEGRETSDDLTRLSSTEITLRAIELRVGGDRRSLYSVLTIVEAKFARLQDFQSQLASAYDRLTLQIAKRFGRSPMQIEDNFQQGSHGLRRAIRYFDPERGKALSGIARWWIKATVLKTIKSAANFVQVPDTVWRQYDKYEQAAHKLGIVGDYNAIAEHFEQDYAEVTAVYEAVHINRPRSFEDPLSSGSGADDQGRLGDKIPDTAPSPEDVLVDASADTIPMYLGGLTEDERKVVCCTFGLFTYIQQRVADDPEAIIIERLCQVAARQHAAFKETAQCQ